ncbi:sigma 54-interacting transcriptional regulator [Hymenobacter sp. 5516J-16]|uniref:RNA repair transcriptional activator RtcR family protein n=1 Tax=Hymenobacter sp. 5516J-16 TaxID=2932253 RepID=UPI001FD540BB|nr:sigma 54-interacting transcriptional regulator [Hymenobacter sp. 5516J-16]UOQ76531.1 sigma 54-interacting transcriptional regulator [Hymenobacter sp. 5516J-16]
MARVLVSWIARNHDFLTNDRGGFGGVNPEGPNPEFHHLYFQAEQLDQHILLYAEARQEMYAEHLVAHLRRTFPGRSVEAQLLELSDIIDLAEVKTKVETWLLAHREHELCLFFSPGTSIMQLSWYICHTTLGLKTRLFQTRAQKFVKAGESGLTEIREERSDVPRSVIIRDEKAKKPAAEAHYQSHILPPALRAVYHRANLVAQTDKVTVLIRGESGTGKEQLARYVHAQSVRSAKPLLTLNCAALTDTVLESRLFGYVKGAFTGADKTTSGLFEQAEGGTVFLDEIGDISPALQVLLLRVLQEGEIQPVGGQPKRVNVRVVAATNAELEDKCRDGRFRWDLYYRLAVAELELPCLREWPAAERRTLLDYLLENKRHELGKAEVLQLSETTRKQLLEYPFPGNIRELENLLESLYVFHADAAIEPSALPRRMRNTTALNGFSLRLADVEKEHLLRVMALKNNIKRQAALALDIDERTLAAKLRSYDLGTAESN